jgi:ATP-dependent Clp protease adapter protein ClpS
MSLLMTGIVVLQRQSTSQCSLFVITLAIMYQSTTDELLPFSILHGERWTISLDATMVKLLRPFFTLTENGGSSGSFAWRHIFRVEDSWCTHDGLAENQVTGLTHMYRYSTSRLAVKVRTEVTASRKKSDGQYERVIFNASTNKHEASLLHPSKLSACSFHNRRQQRQPHPPTLQLLPLPPAKQSNRYDSLSIHQSTKMQSRRLLSLLSLLVTASLLSVSAFTVTPQLARPSAALFMGMAQPEVQIKTKVKTETKQRVKQERAQKTKSGEPVNRREEEFQDAPMYKLMLLADDGYDGEHVVTRMCAIVEDLDEDAASTVFQQAQQMGKAMCGKYPFERAELYKEQLLRSDPMIFSDLEEENA